MANTSLVSFSTTEFESFQNELVESAKKYGIESSISFKQSDIEGTDFFKENNKIFSFPRGFGYWLWKPYFILEALSRLDFGDILIYADSGSLFIADPAPLIKICKENESGIVAFDTAPLTNKQWCKRDTFVLMNCDNPYFWNATHVIATTILFKKNAFVINFVKEWLNHCKQYHALTEAENIYGDNLEGFIKHMGDQPIFSILVRKHNLSTYRNPSQWGNYLKLPSCRDTGEFVGYPYLIDTTISDYSDSPYVNSPYTTIFEFNRKQRHQPTQQTFLMKVNHSLRHYSTYAIRGIKKALRLISAAPINDTHQKLSYSQCGEDLIVDYVFRLRGIDRPSYLDIGANHPYYLSNTAYFYQKGGRGINVEANPYLSDQFKSARPEDITLNIGVGPTESELTFFIMEDNTLSTFSKDECDSMIKNGKALKETKVVRLTTIQNILDEHYNGKFPDFLSIDIEGLDLEILKTIDYSKSTPLIICVEAAEYSPSGAGKRKDELINFLVDKGYYEYANTNLNAIMVRRDFWFTNG